MDFAPIFNKKKKKILHAIYGKISIYEVML